jgi:hypothetical protein
LIKILRLFLIVVSICILFSCTDRREKYGNEIIKKIENFKKIKGHLPENLKEIGVHEDESGPIFYEKQSDTSYLVYYGRNLGESMVYNFKTKKWESDGQ